MYSHYLYLSKQLQPRAHGAPARVVDVPALARLAARESRPVPYATHATMPAVMVHLAGIRTGSWSRRAIMRAHGWWHPAADALIGPELGWGRRRGLLRVGGEGVVRASSRAELDVFVGNLLLISLLLDRTAVVPETPCLAAPTPRSCLDGCAYDSVATASREPRTTRCAWLAPKRCWRSELVTQIEYERAALRAAAAAGLAAPSQMQPARRRLEEVPAANRTGSEAQIEPSDLPTPPSWPQGDEWQTVRQQRDSAVRQQRDKRRKFLPLSHSLKGPGHKSLGSKAVGSKGIGGKGIGGRIKAGTAKGAGLHYGAAKSGAPRCHSDGAWLVAQLERGSNRTSDDKPLARRRALARMVQYVACAPDDGGTAALPAAPQPSAGAGVSDTRPPLMGLDYLMPEPLIRPRARARAGRPESQHAYKASLSEYEREIRQLLGALVQRVDAGVATPALGRVANRTRAAADEAGGIAYQHEIDCIATLLAPPMVSQQSAPSAAPVKPRAKKEARMVSLASSGQPPRIKANGGASSATLGKAGGGKLKGGAASKGQWREA